MSYLKNFVAVIKCNNEILRKKDGFVNLQFGSEYSILIKNLNSRKVLVNISIDGKDVLNNNSLIIESNSKTELKGFLSDNIVKNRFKFIQKSKEIKDYRGDKIDDGFIRIEFIFEKEKPPVQEDVIRNYYKNWSIYPFSPYRKFPFSYPESIYTEDEMTKSNMIQSHLEHLDSVYNANRNLDEGITVEGSEIEQYFQSVNINKLEENSQIIILRLKGKKLNNNIIKDPKLICPTCGQNLTSKANFCERCGTYLN